MKFTICIEEMVSEEFDVEAEDAEQAKEIAEEKYNKGEFVLEPGNLVCKQMCITSPDDECTEWTEF